MMHSVDLGQQNWEVNYFVPCGFTGEEEDELVENHWGESQMCNMHPQVMIDQNAFYGLLSICLKSLIKFLLFFSPIEHYWCV